MSGSVNSIVFLYISCRKHSTYTESFYEFLWKLPQISN